MCDVFQSTVVILIETQIVPSLTSTLLFRMAPEPFIYFFIYEICVCVCFKDLYIYFGEREREGLNRERGGGRGRGIEAYILC